MAKSSKKESSSGSSKKKAESKEIAPKKAFERREKEEEGVCPYCNRPHNVKTNSWTLGFSKLSAMAFILFLLTIFPDAANKILDVHWGWFLGATILFWIIALREFNEEAKLTDRQNKGTSKKSESKKGSSKKKSSSKKSSSKKSKK